MHLDVDLTTGRISNEVYASQAVYDQERQQVFRRTWQWVGHDSMIASPGDFVSTYLGEDSVILTRDQNNDVSVLLNKCSHRGNKVCLFDRGNSRSFKCSYHGWTFDSAGSLVAVPQERAVYGDALDKPALGLRRAARVESLGGLIFATWDADAPSLHDYLGEAAWFLETFVTNEAFGGLQFVPGVHRYIMPVNWKLLAENFAGDDYHFSVTHASVVSLMRQNPNAAMTHAAAPQRRQTIATNFGSGAPHGLLELKLGREPFDDDLGRAERIGPDAVEWVRHRYDVLQRCVEGGEDRPYGFHTGNIFPNLSLNGMSSALYARGFLLQLPRGPHGTEVHQYVAVERDAPESVKRRAVQMAMQRQAVAGMVTPDDHENFERISGNLQSDVTLDVPFDYSMGLERYQPGQEHDLWPEGAARGTRAPQISEINQRDFYRYWLELMRADADGARP